MRNVRPRCPRCERAACICRFAATIANEVALLVLQHPSEARHAKGTVKLLALSLARCTVRVGEQFEPPDDGLPTCLLYPGAADGAAPLRPQRLIVLDGSWRKSRLLLHLNPWLAALPRLSLHSHAPSVYAPLRRAHAPGQLSTLEAAALGLGRLEMNQARYAPLLAGMAGFVQAQLTWCSTPPACAASSDEPPPPAS